MPMPSRLSSASPAVSWMTPRQCGPMTAPATTKNTTSGMGLPGMRLAANDEHTTTASIAASIVS